MTALRRPLTFWLVSLAVASAALSAWLFTYFLGRRWFLSQAHLETVQQQLAAVFASGSPVLLRMFLASPWLAALLAVVCVPLAWLTAKGRRGAAELALLSIAALPVIYVVGNLLLRRLEDRIYFDRSPWVLAFRVGCAVLAAALLMAIGWGVQAAVARRVSAVPPVGRG